MSHNQKEHCCSCGHCHKEENLKSFLIKNISAVLISVLVYFLPINEILKMIIMLIAYLICGYDIIKESVHSITDKKFFDENFLMAFATITAFALGEYYEAVAVMVLFSVGEFLQEKATQKSRARIKSLAMIKPEYANINIDGKLKKVLPNVIKIGEIITVLPGEKIPLDGILVNGSSSIDCSALTGESIPCDIGKGDKVLSGSINLNGKIEIKVTSAYENSTVSRILKLTEDAKENKSQTEKFITKFSKIYTPIVVLIAVLVAILPPILGLGSFSDWIYRALNLIIISCPCALVISIPISFFGGIGGAGKKGILVKGSNFFSALADLDTVVFDKTGTLTFGKFVVDKIISDDKNSLINYAVAIEKMSNHPIANAIKQLNPDKEIKINEVKEIAGKGIIAKCEKGTVLAGNKSLLTDNNIKINDENLKSSVIYFALDDKYLGAIIVKDKIKDNAKKAIENLHKLGVKNVVMLTGDNAQSAKNVADELEIDNFYHSLLPADKANKMSEIKKNAKSVAFVGDGINDAPVLALADVGISMGGIGSDVAVEASDVVLTNDNLECVPKAITCARKTIKIAKENIVFTLGVKILVMVLATLSLCNLWLAVFADVGVAVLTVLNSLRAMK